MKRLEPGRAAQRFAPLGLLGIVLLLVILVGKRGASADDARPLGPDDDARVLQKVPGGGVRAQQARLLATLAKDRQNLDAALQLARLDIQQARAESDPRYLGHAQAALAPWWDLADPPHDVLVLRATIKQSNHDFPAALADLERALASSPDDPQAWLTRATLLQLRGDFAGARESCRHLANLTDPVVVAVCLAGVDGMTGHAVEGYNALSGTLVRARIADPSVRGWAVTELAELALRHGDREHAEQQFREAMGLGPDPYLLAAYADFLLDAKRPAEVVTLLATQTAADNLLLRLVEAEAAVNAPHFAADRDELAGRYAQSRARGDQIHLREEARFTLHIQHRADLALPIALADWDIQKEPADVRLVLEVALAAGDPGAARPVLDWLAQSGFEDPIVRDLAAKLGQGAKGAK